MNVFSSIWNYKCPKCRKGDLFLNPFEITNPLNMHDKCTNCGLSIARDPSYYFGAIFLAYGWLITAILAVVGVCMFFLDWSVEASFGLVVIICAMTYLFILRISRSMYIHMDVRYDKELSTKLLDSEISENKVVM